MFCTDRKTDCVRFDSLIKQFFFCQLRMCCCCRMDNKALNIRNICKQRKDLQVVDELVSFFLSAFDLECEDRCSTIREIFFIKCMIRMIRQRRMINVLY